MIDVLTPEQRRLNMSRIRGTNTKPERLLRSALHAKGLRYTLHRRDLPGCPDIVFTRRKVAVFVDGCFWHGCPKHSVKPKTNRRFWLEKISANRKRDKKVTKQLRILGWKVVRVWEHDLNNTGIHRVVRMIKRLVHSR